MAKIDLEKYKNAWKQEQTFDEQLLSENEIETFMRSAGRSILALFKKGLVFDVVFKGLLLILLVVLTFLYPYAANWVAFCLGIALFLIGGIFWQNRTIHNIPNPDKSEQNALDLLRQYVSFYHRYYYPSIFVSAFSSVFLFLIGSLYYVYFKYREIQPLQTDDLLVLGIGLVLNFVFSAIVQIKQGNYHVRQLEERITEIEEHVLSKGRLEEHQDAKIRNYTLIGLAFLTGLLLLLYLIFRQLN